MDAITATFSHHELEVLAGMASDPDVTATFAVSDDPTEQMAALTVEQTLFDQPMPLPPSEHGEPAYFVEVRRPRGTSSLLAVRNTLDEAVFIAGSVHPSVADVLIRELSLPCDAEAMLRAATSARTWCREPTGCWVPALPRP